MYPVVLTNSIGETRTTMFGFTISVSPLRSELFLDPVDFDVPFCYEPFPAVPVAGLSYSLSLFNIVMAWHNLHHLTIAISGEYSDSEVRPISHSDIKMLNDDTMAVVIP